MTPERRQQADHLLQAALEKPAAERGTFLQQACADDEALLQELTTQLAAQTHTADLQEVPTAALTAEALEQSTGELLRGRMLGRYELQSALGRGGMGTVFQAQDTQLGRPIALKILPRRFTSDAERVRRFRQEARAISALNHPNILTIHEIGAAALAEGEVHFLATELVEGRTLRARLNDRGLMLGEVLDIATQTAGALAAAHQAGIIHRDIKPENIMVRPDGLVKVLDFGLAKLIGKQPKTATAASSYSTVHTDPGWVMGTLSYMSPEQARGLEVDARSDLFSLGVVFYEMLTGRAPFAGATTGDVLVSIINREPPPLAVAWPRAPARLQQIVNRALAKEGDQRYQQATEFATDLKDFKQELELAARVKRQGDTPDGAVSLDLHVGQAASGAVGQVAAAYTTEAAARPTNQSRRLLTRLIPRVQPLLWGVTILATLLAGLAVYRYWRTLRTTPVFNTLAVLPFVNVTGDPEVEYLADGLTESLMQNLQQQLPELRVMARGTVFTYKGREVDPRQVGQDLQVRAVITGRVQRQGERLLIGAELADTSDGTQLWSERYQRPAADLQALQAEIVREVSLKLQPQLRGVAPAANSAPAVNSQAYQLYLKGRYFQRQLTQAGGEKALELFQQALALDPKFALPHSGIALVYQDFSSQFMTPREAIAKARQAALTALALDDQLAEAHFALAQTKAYDWDWAGAELEFKRALALNPNFIDARYYYAEVLTRVKRFDEAEAVLTRAAELDPLSQHICQGLSYFFYYTHQNERARVQADKTLELDPTGIWASGAHRIRASLLLQQQRPQEGLAEMRQAFDLNRTLAMKSWLGYACAATGQPREARALLRELQAAAQTQWVSPVYFARIHLGLGEYQEAINWLQKGFAAQSDHLVHLSVEPIYDPLRSDPRFQQIMRGLGFVP